MSAQISREQIIADGRAMLDWLAAHPEVPLPDYGGVEVHFNIGDDDTTGPALIAGLAAQIDGEHEVSPEGHHRAFRTWGTARYKVAYVERASMDRYYAEQRAGAVSE